MAMASSINNFEAARTQAGLTGWTRSTTHAPCRWSRVVCDHAGTIRSIDLSGLGLQGTHFPRSIAGSGLSHMHIEAH